MNEAEPHHTSYEKIVERPEHQLERAGSRLAVDEAVEAVIELFLPDAGRIRVHGGIVLGNLETIVRYRLDRDPRGQQVGAAAPEEVDIRVLFPRPVQE